MDIERLKMAFGDRLLTNEPLAMHTTFGIGGPGDYFVVVNALPELVACVRAAWQGRLPYLILGMGANLLVADKGVRGLVVRNECKAVQFSRDDEGKGWLLKAESGAALRHVARQALERGLAGLEWAVDVPGTVGGAVVGNAGAFGGYISDSLRGIRVFTVDEGERWKPHGELGLAYRTSSLKKGKKTADSAPVILSATFALHSDDVTVLQARAAEYNKRRVESQPVGMSAGSVFKRTDQYPAGFLIENAGLKGTRVGGAIVSPQHANFIINTGTATAQDVQELIELVRTTVYAKFKIMLELEVELAGDW
jgi:UDP-N-acetylmuramate dehydrogenase